MLTESGLFISFAYLIVYLTSAFVVVWATPLVKSFAMSIGKADLPSARKVHSKPTVRLGGIAIFLGFIASLIASMFILGGQLLGPDNWRLFLFCLGAAAFFSLGLADDFLDLSSIFRLVLQLVISSAIWKAGFRIDLSSIFQWDDSLLIFLSFITTIIWIAGVVNAINWIDGLDGLASGVCSVGAAGIIVVALVEHQQLPLVLAIGLLGSLSGFLRHNVNPAQIFMGDSGSYFIGFSLAALCLLGPFQLGGATGVGLSLAIVALPILDMLFVVLVRLWQGLSPFKADRRHLHHRLLALGFSHRTCVEVMCLLSLLISGLLLTVSPRISWTYCGFLVLMVVSIIIWKLSTSKSITGLFSIDA